MADHSENTHVVKTPSGKSGGAAFPENVEPKGKIHFGPAPRPPRPSVENPLNTDRHGTRRPGDR